MLDRLGLNRHVSDADLTALVADARLGLTPPPAAAGHVRDCAPCKARLHALGAWLDGLRSDAWQEADEAFSRERLAAQQAQIMRRLEAMERPARVLTFPKFARPISTQHAGRQRWIAGAAAAGLIVGIGLGQTLDFRRGMAPPEDIATAAPMARSGAAPDRMGVQPISLTTDEDFLYGQDAVSARVPDTLQVLHEITPSAREYDPR